MITLGIIGNGFVGKATCTFESTNIKLIIYDIDQKLCKPLGTKLEDMKKCDFIFIAVPTPMSENGSCYTGILESVVADLKNIINEKNNFIVIRSTIPMGTSDKLDCYFMPEFLTEKNWENDFINNENWIFGLKDSEDNILFKKKINELINFAYDNNKIKHKNIIFMKNDEAELVKYFRNTFLSVKVAYCNEIEQYCKSKKINYNTVRNVACLDPRIGLSHTQVPGPDGRRGFGGTCFPKDTNSLRFQFLTQDLTPYMLNAAIERNITIDRPEQDWNTSVGRAVIKKENIQLRIIVTGGAGFIGSHLCKKLINEGENVICIDNLLTGNLDNISDLFKNKNFEFIKMDIVNLHMINFNNVKEFYHLACPASPIKYQSQPLQTLNTCIQGTKNILELAKKNNAKVLFTSTSEVYGDSTISPQNEEYKGNVNCFGPRACYDEGKRVAETLCYEYIKLFNLDIKIARVFNTYGSNMHPYDGRIITNFIRQATNNNDITIYGDGLQTRSFCYISDQIRGLRLLMKSNINKPINIGNPEEYKIIDVAKIIISLTNSNSRIVFEKLPEDDPKRRKPDIQMAKELLKWYPEINLIEGLKKLIGI